MKCCGSPTTSIVRDASVASRRADPDRGDTAREVAAQFEALLIREAFAPLAKAIGFYGESAVTVAAQAMARAGVAGLTDRFASAIASPAEASR